jgi:2-methylisocitrate lyase-like PEP mutase family enzyme
MADSSRQRSAFRSLHQSGCFVLPNPWDAGTTRCLCQMGFKAVATTSAGFAFSRGLPDSPLVLTRDAVLGHIREIVAAAGDVPVNADFQAGYADSADGVAESVRMCVQTGVAGLSIEDATGEADRPLFEIEEAVDRLRAARAAIDGSKSGVLLTGRAECYLVGHPDPLRESIKRLTAYAEAGADVLYAPDVEDHEEIRTIIRELAPKPVNVLVCKNLGLRVADLAAMGARRISVGSALARAAWGGLLAAVRPIAESGSFSGFDRLTRFGELNDMFARP